MLKGQFPVSIWFTVFAVVFAMMGILYFGMVLMNEMTSYANFAENSIENMNSIDAAHFIEQCFSNGTGIIDWAFLDSNEKRNVCAIEGCQLCAFNIGLKIEDLEKEAGKNMWLFDFSESAGIDHEMAVSIRDASEIHIGRMYVQLA